MQSVEWGWRGRNFSRVLSARSSPTRGEETSSPQEERAIKQTAHLLVFEPFSYLFARTEAPRRE
jgi:hypothetical protein